jgi:DNA-binding MurR/RpiR family transcriptional regulator
MISERIKAALPDMQPVNRKIALYMLENVQSVGLSSIYDLSALIGVSNASIVRFAKGLGFSGYIEFRKVLMEEIKRRLEPEGKVALHDLDVLPQRKQLEKLATNEIRNLSKTLDDLDLAALMRMIEGVGRARRVFLSGFGVSRNMVRILEYALLGVIDKEIVGITGSISDYSPRLRSLGAEDAVFIVTFPPYSREAVQVAGFAKEAGAAVFLFTDSPRCPIYSMAETVITCENNSLLLTNSYVGLVAVVQIFINMLLLNDRTASASRAHDVIEVERKGYADLGAQEDKS